jgi:hypothetical protein
MFWRLARLEKRLDLGSATRNATPHSAMHRVAWAQQTAKGTDFAEMQKTLGKPGFLSGEDRNRTFPHFSCDFYSRAERPSFQRLCQPFLKKATADLAQDRS